MPQIGFALPQHQSLYLAKVRPGTYKDSFGTLCINRGDESKRWYIKYTSDHIIQYNTILLPFWLAVEFDERTVVGVETVENNIKRVDKLNLRYKPLAPLPCGVNTMIIAVKKQLINQLVFPRCIIPITAFGKLVFFDVETQSDGVGVVDSSTEILFSETEKVNSCNVMTENHDLEKTLLLHIKLWQKFLRSPDTCHLVSDVFILENVDRDLAWDLLNKTGLCILRLPVELLLRHIELDVSSEGYRESLELFNEWGRSSLSKDILILILFESLAFLPKEAMKRIATAWNSWKRQSNCALVLISELDETTELFAKIFPYSTVLTGSSSNRHTLQRSFKTEFNAKHQGISLEEAKEKVDREFRTEQLDMVCSVIPAGWSSWDNIVGYDQVTKRIKQLLYGIALQSDRLGQLGLQMVKGILLQGPPGCGKSELIKAIANDRLLPVIKLKPTDILSKYFGESEARLRRVFSKAREMRPCILLIDNIEVLGARRRLRSSDTTGIDERILSTLLNEMDGIEGSTGVIVIGCTSQVDILDEALIRPGRFDHHIYLPIPDLRDLQAIILALLTRLNFFVNQDMILELARKLQGKSVAEIKNLFNQYAFDHVNDPLPLDTSSLLRFLNETLV